MKNNKSPKIYFFDSLLVGLLVARIGNLRSNLRANHLRHDSVVSFRFNHVGRTDVCHQHVLCCCIHLRFVSSAVVVNLVY